jgi:hypothetical protein
VLMVLDEGADEAAVRKSVGVRTGSEVELVSLRIAGGAEVD